MVCFTGWGFNHCSGVEAAEAGLQAVTDDSTKAAEAVKDTASSVVPSHPLWFLELFLTN